MRLSHFIALNLIATSLVGCGAGQQSHISDDPKAETSDAVADLNGVHSPHGWTDSISFYVSADANDEVVSAAEKAAKTWNEAVGFDLLVFEGRGDGEQMSDLYSPLTDKKTVIYFDHEWTHNTIDPNTNNAKPRSTLATTVWENGVSDVQSIVRGDIILNAEAYAFIDALGPQAPVLDSSHESADAESVILHEMGHLLGLDHVSSSVDGESVMHAETFVGYGIAHRDLSHGDIQRIRGIYSK